MSATAGLPARAPRRHTRSPTPLATVTYRVGDRVTGRHTTTDGGTRRYIGTVTGSGPVLFTVTWEGWVGVGARYTHGCEPSTLRRATLDDDDHTSTEVRAGIAEELRRIAACHHHWPTHVRGYLTPARPHPRGGTVRSATSRIAAIREPLPCPSPPSRPLSSSRPPSLQRPPPSYTNRLKDEQKMRYGENGVADTDLEEDHLVPLELAGNPTDEHNLWPQPRTGPPRRRSKGHRGEPRAPRCLGRADQPGRRPSPDPAGLDSPMTRPHPAAPQRSRSLLLHGRAGAGKTTLIQHVRRHLHTHRRLPARPPAGHGHRSGLVRLPARPSQRHCSPTVVRTVVVMALLQGL